MDINQKFVITISREIGSGGHTIGKKLADKLGVRFCDKDLIENLREKFGLTTYEIEHLKGEKKNWLSGFFEKINPIPPRSVLNEPASVYLGRIRKNVTTDDIHDAEAEILKAIAEESSCVIAGRSAFFVLADCPNKFDVFITASRDRRIERVMSKQQLTFETAAIIVDEIDKMRENYVKRYTGKSRYDARNYHLTLNMDELTEDQAVQVILTYLGAE